MWIISVVRLSRNENQFAALSREICSRGTTLACSTNWNALRHTHWLVHIVRSNICSLCSENWPHIRRVRGCLTLMLAAAANATATPAPARLHRFTNVPLGVPFATARTRRTSQVLERLPRDPTIQVGEWFGALSGIETSSLRSSTSVGIFAAYYAAISPAFSGLKMQVVGCRKAFRFSLMAAHPDRTVAHKKSRCFG